ncbi:DUF4113 domain-containing protein [Ktedonobacter racemifer]
MRRLSFGSQGAQRTWYMRQERRSKRFTTRWDSARIPAKLGHLTACSSLF